MIQPQELRIGNYVDYNGEIIKLDGSLLCCYIQNELEFPLNPIPLTEEILSKFGFIRNQIKTISEVIDVSGNDKLLEFEVTEMGLDLWISSDKIDEALYFPVNYIKYAHNLQNLYFALTGEELTF